MPTNKIKKVADSGLTEKQLEELRDYLYESNVDYLIEALIIPHVPSQVLLEIIED